MATLYEQALKLAAKKVIVKELVEKELAEWRYKICLECPSRQAENDTCGICHCFLDIKSTAKTNWNARRLRNEITHCPAGKWGDIEIANFYRQMDGKELLTIKS